MSPVPCGFKLFLAVIVFAIHSTSSDAAIHQVQNASQLQTALTTSQYNGEYDTIRLAQGSYVGNFVYASHANEGLSIEGGWRTDFSSRVVKAENTVLDGNNSGNTFVFSCDQPVSLVLDGITFQNGLIPTGHNGSGVFVSIIGEYDWVLEPNFIRIENSIIRNNSAKVTTHAYGIGLYIWTHADVTIKNNTISGNSPSADSNPESVRGGGMDLSTAGNVDIIGNTFSYNRAGSGGGIYLDTNYQQVRIIGNTFTGNHSDSKGGGLYAFPPSLYSSSTIISGNIFSKNSSNRYGGGFFLWAHGENYIITNNQITGNTAAWRGGGLTIWSDPFGDQTINFINNTIAYNTAGREGGGIDVMMQGDSETYNLYNNIFWGNRSTNPGFDLYLENDVNDNYLAGEINLFNNDFNQSGWGIYWDIPFAINSSNMNYRDPLFVSAQQGNYTLSNNSPCLNAGTNQAPHLPNIDLSGNPRIMGNFVDMGAYEGAYGNAATKGVLTPLLLLLK